MDNSIVELGGAVDDDMIAHAVNIVRGSASKSNSNIIPVLPDVMGDGAATIDLSAQAYNRWWHDEDLGPSYMLVTQGSSWEDFIQLVDYFFLDNPDRFKKIRWVGIPRKLLLVIPSRRWAVEYIQMVAPSIKIHLLGFSDDIYDERESRFQIDLTVVVMVVLGVGLLCVLTFELWVWHAGIRH